VWSGSISDPKRSGVPFDVDATLVDGQALPDLMPTELVVKGAVPQALVENYLKEKAKVATKLRSVFRFSSPDNKDQQAYNEYSEFLGAQKKWVSTFADAMTL
jgi:hypothetical protein